MWKNAAPAHCWVYLVNFAKTTYRSFLIWFLLLLLPLLLFLLAMAWLNLLTKSLMNIEMLSRYCPFFIFSKTFFSSCLLFIPSISLAFTQWKYPKTYQSLFKSHRHPKVDLTRVQIPDHWSTNRTLWSDFMAMRRSCWARSQQEPLKHTQLPICLCLLHEEIEVSMIAHEDREEKSREREMQNLSKHTDPEVLSRLNHARCSFCGVCKNKRRFSVTGR